MEEALSVSDHRRPLGPGNMRACRVLPQGSDAWSQSAHSRNTLLADGLSLFLFSHFCRNFLRVFHIYQPHNKQRLDAALRHRLRVIVDGLRKWACVTSDLREESILRLPTNQVNL